jgi:hypothetical protein
MDYAAFRNLIRTVSEEAKEKLSPEQIEQIFELMDNSVAFEVIGNIYASVMAADDSFMYLMMSIVGQLKRKDVVIVMNEPEILKAVSEKETKH